MSLITDRQWATNLVALLADLGGTADEIAAFLQREGYTGRRNSPSNCPLARYLRAQKHVPADLRVFSYAEIDWEIVGQLKTPKPVRDFIVQFDRGDFPQLVDGRTTI